MSPFLSEFTDWLKAESFQFSISDVFNLTPDPSPAERGAIRPRVAPLSAGEGSGVRLGDIDSSIAKSISDTYVTIENQNLTFHLIPLNFSEIDVATNSIRPRNDDGRMLFVATQKNHRLIHLHEDVWRTQQNLVKSRIRSLLGRFKKVNGRHCFVERIDKKISSNFLNNNHLQYSVKSKYQYGLFLKSQYAEKFLGIEPSQNPENTLVAVATFSGGRAMKFGERAGQRSYELLRFASLSGYVVVGGLDKLLQAFIKEHQPDDIMTYADADWSDGRSYKVLGFDEIGAIPPQEFWINPVTFERVSGGNVVENKNTFLKTYNTGSIKFIKFIPKNNVE